VYAAALLAVNSTCQLNRYKNPLKLNASLNNRDLKRHANLEPNAEDLLNQAAYQLSISARSYMRVLKVARTIADLDGNTTIRPNHIGEALQYRRLTPALVL
jgi:magnesium chelatase family protein